jgi:hypothetical protein
VTPLGGVPSLLGRRPFGGTRRVVRQHSLPGEYPPGDASRDVAQSADLRPGQWQEHAGVTGADAHGSGDGVRDCPGRPRQRAGRWGVESGWLVGEVDEQGEGSQAESGRRRGWRGEEQAVATA